MKKTITRTFKSTIIEGATIVAENELPVVVTLEPVTILGELTFEKALKELRKKHGESATLISIKITETTYELDVDVFMKYATKVEE